IANFFFQAEGGIRDFHVTGVQTCALPIYHRLWSRGRVGDRSLALGGRGRRGLLLRLRGSPLKPRVGLDCLGDLGRQSLAVRRVDVLETVQETPAVEQRGSVEVAALSGLVHGQLGASHLGGGALALEQVLELLGRELVLSRGVVVDQTQNFADRSEARRVGKNVEGAAGGR